MLWILFSILAALLWAIVHILDKIILTKLIKNPVISLLFLGIIGLIISFIVYLFYGFSELSYFNILLSFIASICYVLMIYFYFEATQLEEISRVVSFFRITPLFVLIFSVFLFNEIFSFSKYLGIILLILGSILISFKKSVKLTFGKSFRFIIIAAIFSALNTIITKYLLNFTDFWTVFAYLRIGVFVVLIPFFYWNFSELMLIIKKRNKKIIGLISLNELLNLFGILFITIAISLNSATLVSALSSIYPFFVLVFAVILSVFYPHILKEEIGKSTLAIKIIAIILIFVGAVLIT